MDQTVVSKFEKRVWLILSVILLVVLVSGFFVFRSLTGIVNDLTEEARPDETVILMKEILYDLTDAENSVKSYTLTGDAIYLEEFNFNYSNAELKVTRLLDLTKDESDSKIQVEKLDSLTAEKFLILEDILLVSGQSRVGSALDKVSEEIVATVSEDNSINTNTSDKEDTNESGQESEDKFFKKLLNKRKQNNKHEVVQPEIETSDLDGDVTLEEINQEILQIKKEEERIDKSVREKELFLIQEDKKITDQILAVFSKMEELETLSMDEKLQLADSKSKKTNLLIGVFCLLACALLFLAGYTVNAYVRRNESFKIALRRAKQEADIKNKEITDSIVYAQKIQEAILPDRKLFSAHLNDAFIFYKPKDIVAGDFYWCVKTESHLFVAVADCTGHGVPGAMVSVVCSTALNRCVREFGLKKPAEILNKCRELVIETFSGGNYSVNDGMDIALISLSQNSAEIIVEYAGANNSLYVVRNGVLQDLTADKQPIGNYQYSQPFTNHKLVLESGAMLYLFSDGFADQFGGPFGKKFKYKPFQELLIQNSNFDTLKQHRVLEEKFESWRGSLEQIDDVCIIGVRI